VPNLALVLSADLVVQDHCLLIRALVEMSTSNSVSSYSIAKAYVHFLYNIVKSCVQQSRYSVFMFPGSLFTPFRYHRARYPVSVDSGNTRSSYSNP
jgi:hypothetical protein